MALADLISIRPRGQIGEIVAQAVLSERHTDEITITSHPVELGAQISDHAYKRPAEVTLQYGWSEAQLASLLGSSFTNPVAVFGDLDSIYQKLLLLQARREVFEILTGKRQYSNMLLQNVSVTTDEKSEHVLLLTAVCVEVIIVQTRATTLPPRAKQKKPNRTAGIVPHGTNQLKTASPAPGGAVPLQ